MSTSFVPVIHGAALDTPDEVDTRITADAVAASLARLGYDTEILFVGNDLAPLAKLSQRDPLVVFNLVEALGGEDARAIEPLQLMQRLDLAHTGAGLAAYADSTSKIAAKRMMTEAGIPTPRHWPRGAGIPLASTVIVKSVEQHGSVGMDAGCIVAGPDAAREIAVREAQFGGAFFAEEFIAGREFNVALLETTNGLVVLPIQEIDFSGLPEGEPAIVDYAAKWDPTSIGYHATPRRFGTLRTDPAIAEDLTRMSISAWRLFGLSGYARVDFRVGGDGSAYVLEVNANPCLAPDAGFAAASAEAGLPYDQMIATIVTAAAARAGKAH